MSQKSSPPPIRNHLLAALPREEYMRLLPWLESVSLPFMEILYEGGEPIKHVYFPDDGLISLLVVMDDGTVREIGVIGRWLLMTHDHAPGDEFEMKHEFMAMMLGVTRSVVTRAAGHLQSEKMIRYTRGE